MNLSRDDWAYLRSLAGELKASWAAARGTYVHLDVEYVEMVVEALQAICEAATEPAASKPKAKEKK